MPKLIIQRTDRLNYFEKYPVYINSSKAGNLAFADTLTLHLEPGRYLLQVGGFNSREANFWVDLKENNQAFEVKNKRLKRWRKWPKRWQAVLSAKPPMHLASSSAQAKLKKEYLRAELKLGLFNLLFFALLFVPINYYWETSDGLFLALTILGLLVIWQINTGARRFLIRQEPRP